NSFPSGLKFKAVIRVPDTDLPLDGSAPAQLIGNRGRNRRAQRKRDCLLGEIPKVDIDNKRGLPRIEIDYQGTVFGQRRRPEEAIGGEAGIIGVDLCRRVNLTL